MNYTKDKPIDLSSIMTPDWVIHNKDGKPILEMKYKHEERVLVYKEHPQHMFPEDVAKCDAFYEDMKKLAQRYRVGLFDIDEITRCGIAAAKDIPADGMKHEIKILVEEKSTGKHVTMVLGLSSTPEGTTKVGMRKMMKTYHVHVNSNPHFDDYYHPEGRWFRHNETSPEWHGDSGCRYHIQVIHRNKDYEGGATVFGTCSKLKLKLYIIYLKLRGYRQDERKW